MTASSAGRRASSAAIVDRVAIAPVGSRRVERTLSTMMSVFGVLFGLQSVPALVEDWPNMASPLGLALVVLVFGSIGVAGVAAVLRQWTRTVFLLCGLSFLGALFLWPQAIIQPLPVDSMPWLLAIAGVPCALVIVACRGWVAPLVYAVAVAIIFIAIRTTVPGGGLDLVAAVMSGIYALVLAVAMLAVVVAVRVAARRVDLAQSTALGRYADAQVDGATESERTRTDALVHDSVLTTFLSAAGALSPEAQVLTAKMAQNAMHVLSRATVASHTGPKVPLAELLARMREDAAGVGEHFAFEVEQVRDRFLPDSVADAVVSATVQAMTNSVKHAGDGSVVRSLTVQGTEAGGVRVVIDDRGSGFDPDTVASERLGVRVSIYERMDRVGGEVDLRTAPGEGTTFVLSWPAAAHAPMDVEAGLDADTGAIPALA